MSHNCVTLWLWHEALNGILLQVQTRKLKMIMGIHKLQIYHIDFHIVTKMCTFRGWSFLFVLNLNEQVEINIPELNPEMVGSLFLLIPLKMIWVNRVCNAQDVYRIGTLMELIRTIALSFADDGRRVKVISLISLKTRVLVPNHLTFYLQGMHTRIHGGRCTFWNATAACWDSEDLRIHGLGRLWGSGDFCQDWFNWYWTQYMKD